MATPKQYAAVFGMSGDAEAVLEDLARLFAGAPFVAGQADTTAYNCGTKAVIEHIHGRIALVEPQQRGS